MRGHLPIPQHPFEREVIFCVQGVKSPLLSNIVLDEFDRELERRGLRSDNSVGVHAACVRLSQ